MDRWATSARSLASPATSPIASQGKACAQHFHQLCTLLEDAERQAMYGISHLQVSECSGQFRIWAGNIGALQTIQSASSLDYRLREVPKVSKQVLSLLEDLEEALADGTRSSCSYPPAFSCPHSLGTDCFKLLQLPLGRGRIVSAPLYHSLPSS
jgi:hypothetical protein